MLPVFSDNTEWKCDESSPKWREDCNKVECWERFNPIMPFIGQLIPIFSSHWLIGLYP